LWNNPFFCAALPVQKIPAAKAGIKQKNILPNDFGQDVFECKSAKRGKEWISRQDKFFSHFETALSVTPSYLPVQAASSPFLFSDGQSSRPLFLFS